MATALAYKYLRFLYSSIFRRKKARLGGLFCGVLLNIGRVIHNAGSLGAFTLGRWQPLRNGPHGGRVKLGILGVVNQAFKKQGQ